MARPLWIARGSFPVLPRDSAMPDRIALRAMVSPGELRFPDRTSAPVEPRGNTTPGQGPTDERHDPG